MTSKAPEPDSILLEQQWSQTYQPLDFIDSTWYHGMDAPITREELTTVIKELPNNKSPGPSEVSYDMLKLITDPVSLDYIVDTLNF